MSATNVLINVVCPSLGVLISNMMFLSPWSLVMTARKNRHLGNVNPIPFAIMFVNNLGFVVYGSLLSNYYIFFSSVFGVLLSLFYTITCLTIMAKEAIEDEFSELYLQVEWTVLGGIGFWAIIGIVQTSLFHSFADQQIQARTMVGYICCFFNICYYAAPLSTMAEIISKKDSSSLYLPNVLVNCLNATLWLCYGAFGVNNVVVWGPSFIGLCLSLLQVALVFKYHQGHWFEAVSGWITHRTIQMKTRIADDSTDAGSSFAMEIGGEQQGGSTVARKYSRVAIDGARRMSFCITPVDQPQQSLLTSSSSKKNKSRKMTPSSS